jgi:hypothetical protein
MASAQISFKLAADVPLPYACDWTGADRIENAPSHHSLTSARAEKLIAHPPAVPAQSRRKAVAAFLSAHCESNGRKEYVEELMKHIDVHSYGGCLHNMDRPADRSSGNWEDAKLDVLKEYVFVIAMENTNEDDYVTEKVRLP